MFQVRTSSHSDIVEIEGQEDHTQAIDWTETQTFWLTSANIAVGVATLSCFVALGYGLAKDIRDRIHKRRASQAPATGINDQTFEVPGLGLTMADGGELYPPASKGEDKAGREPKRRAGKQHLN